MANSKFGEVSWDEETGNGNGKQKNASAKDLFLRLDDGENEMRLVTKPFQYLVHKYKKDANNPKDYGQKVNCSSVNGSCPLCDLGDKPKQRWLLGVISRKTGKYQVLDIAWSVFSDIQKLNKNQHWGDPTKYDISVIVSRNADPANYYSVVGIPKQPLSAADQEIKDKADTDDLKRRVTPPDAAYVQRRLDAINGVAPSAQKPSQGQQSAPPQQVIAKVDNTPAADDDDDDAFPNYEA